MAVKSSGENKAQVFHLEKSSAFGFLCLFLDA
jgi:hypothetical protein